MLRSICLYTLLTLCCFYSLYAQGNRPNFVIIIGDDISWNDLGCYGNTAVKSPNVDKMSAEGLTFYNAYLTASSCSPSRCSIMSGRYPHNTGAAELHTALPQGMPTLAGELRKSGYYTASAGKWHMGPDVKEDFDLVVEEDNGNGGHKQWVRVLQERPMEKPFFMWFAALDAHRDWHADDFGTPHDPKDVIVPPYLADLEGTRQDLASYYNEIQRLDHYLGLVRRELENQEVLDNTIILYMADNGRPFPRAKTRVYDSGMKTPFVLFWPEGVEESGARSSSLISVIDIAPTFLELAEVEIGPSFQGLSFASIIKDPSLDIRRYVFAEHNWHDYEAHERMVRSKNFMYVRNSRPLLPNQGPADSNRSLSYTDLKNTRDEGELTAAQSDVFITPRAREELFDCIRDPEQLLNLASTSQFREVLDDMRQVLDLWIDETGDDVPVNITKSAFDPETGELLPSVEAFNQVQRGEMPGTSTNATQINNKGPY